MIELEFDYPMGILALSWESGLLLNSHHVEKCFDASKSIDKLNSDGVRNIIFTSGTLAPLHEYISNLGLDTFTKEIRLLNDIELNYFKW